MTTAAVRCSDLTVCYGARPALLGLGVTIPWGSLTAVVGPNGSGKTTLLNAIAGLHPPRRGRIEIASALSAALGYLPQRAHIELDVPLCVVDLVALGAWRRTGAFRGLDAQVAREVDRALERVGLAAMGRQRLGSLSSGQLQRALFARLLVEDPKLILLDEPFNAIDERTTSDLVDIVREWHATGRTVLTVMHDLALVRSAFPDVLLIGRGGIAHGPTATTLTAERLEMALSTAAACGGGDPRRRPVAA